MFEFLLSQELKERFKGKLKVGQLLYFKAEWDGRTPRRYIVQKIKPAEFKSNVPDITACAMYPYGKLYAEEEQGTFKVRNLLIPAR